MNHISPLQSSGNRTKTQLNILSHKDKNYGGWHFSHNYDPTASVIIGLIILGMLEAILLFSGAVFGPWVGFFIGGIGFFTSIYTLEDISRGGNFTINDYLVRDGSVWPFHLSCALLGFIAGLTLLKTKGRFNKFRTIAYVEGVIALATIIILSAIDLIYAAAQGYNTFTNFLILLLLPLPGLVLLPIAIFIYSKTVGNKKPVI